MPRIAIVGSCISRDLWPIRGDGVADLLYISRTSLPSLFAPAIEGFVPKADPPVGLGPFQHRAMVEDIRKTALARLVGFRPTHLIVDFIDDRHDLLTVGDSLISESWELRESGYLSQSAFAQSRRIPRLSAGCERLWLDGLASFAGLLSATPLRQAQVILHSARWADHSVAGDQISPLSGVEIVPGRPADIDAHNVLLTRYETAFLREVPMAKVVAAPELRLADEGHRWGLSPFHYIPAYYEAVWRQLEPLGVRQVIAA